MHLQELQGSDKSRIPESEKINKSGVSTDQYSTAKDKQAFGEIIYSLIENQDPENAEKLTGILLEMDVQSLENLIKDADLLESKVREVLTALQNTSEPMQNGQIEAVPNQHCDKLVIGEDCMVWLVHSIQNILKRLQECFWRWTQNSWRLLLKTKLLLKRK